MERLHRTEIDGVPVFWQQGPAPLSGGLVFAAGRRDETFVTSGVTHLLEHLVMRSLPKSHVDRNASTGPRVTDFYATGRDELVVEFLGQVCAALGDLPLDGLATEARVLAAEEAHRGGDLVGLLCMLRFGAQGFGLLGLSEPRLPDLTPAEVREHAARFFVRENAALWLTGPPPAGLRLPLPSGTAPTRAPQARLPLALPAQTRYPGHDLAMSFEVLTDDAALTGLRVLLDRVTDRLRHEGGHSYHVDFDLENLGGGRGHVVFVADAPPKEQAAAVLLMWQELHRFLEEGPTAEELAHDVAGFREHLLDPRAVEGVLASAILRHFAGKEPLDQEQRLREAAARTRADVLAALQPAVETLLVLVPDDAPAVLPAVPVLPEGTGDVLQGTVWKRRLRSDVPPGSVLTTAPEGVQLRVCDTAVLVRYADCVAVGIGQEGHRHLELLGQHALTVVVCEEDWKDGSRLLDEVSRGVAGVPTYPLREDRD